MAVIDSDILQKTVEGLGYELVDVEFVSAGRQPILRIYIDAAAGVALEDCVLVSRQVSAVLDVEDRIPGAYRLEVSSPGLDRPLKKREDFARFIGRVVTLRLRYPVDGQRRFKGVLKGLAGDVVTLDVDGLDCGFPYEEIEKTRLVPELD